MTDAPNRGKGVDCIKRGVAAGMLDAARADDLIREIQKIEAQNFDALGPYGAKSQANIDALEMAKYNAAIRRRATLMGMLDLDRVSRAMDETKAQKGLKDSSSLLRNLVDSVGSGNLKFKGARQEAEVVKGYAFQSMDNFLKKFHSGPGGFARNKAQLVNVLKEIKGEATGDIAAKQMAHAWQNTAEMLRKMYNAVGGAIPHRKNWDLPQSHSFNEIRKLENDLGGREPAFQQWHDFIAPKLDREQMLENGTGKPLSDARLRDVLKNVYDTIRSEGWDARQPSGNGFGTSVAMRHQESRVLHFATAGDWLAYHQRFGDDDIFGTMIGHIDGMAREIGAMRALGANPQATIRFMAERNLKDVETNGTLDALNIAKSKGAQLDTLYRHFIGEAASPVNGKVGRFFSSTRQFLVSAQLGSAVISALTDLGFTHVTAQFNGLSTTKMMGRYLSLLNPANVADRKLAIRLGLIAEEWTHVASSQMRFTGEVMSGEIMKRLSDATLRVSGLSAHTQAGRWAFGMEFMGHLADQVHLPLDQLNKPLQNALKRYDISPAEWDVMRSTQIYEPTKGGYLRPDDILQRQDIDPKTADKIASKYLNMVHSETEFAIPSASLLGKSFLLGDARPGSFAGEMMRSGGMYKNFAVTMAHTHMARMIETPGAWNKLKYGANLTIGTTLMGALAVQLKDMAIGRDPRPMADKKFWLAAALQGGGLGIFGDYLFSSVDRNGHGFVNSLTGPTTGFIGDTADLARRLLVAGADKVSGGALADASKLTVGRDAANYAGRYMPLGSSLWYTKYIWRRAMADNLQRWLDPNAEKSFAAQRSSWNSQQGADFWGKPGGGLVPQRMPDFMNAFRSVDEGKAAAKGRRYGVDPTGQNTVDIQAQTEQAMKDHRNEAARKRRAAKNAAKKQPVAKVAPPASSAPAVAPGVLAIPN